MVLNLH